jgi:hypothetical protein
MAPSRRIEGLFLENLALRDAVSDETAPQDEVFKFSHSLLRGLPEMKMAGQ